MGRSVAPAASNPGSALKGAASIFGKGPRFACGLPCAKGGFGCQAWALREQRGRGVEFADEGAEKVAGGDDGCG
jgi:hypothetical protein